LAFFTKRKQAAPWRARHLLAIVTGKFSEGKLAGKNAKDGIFPRFPGFRLRFIA
jgi:hypothetical protein